MSPKFYFRDVGSVNALTRRRNLEPGQETFGKAFENWLCHELQAHAHYSGRNHEIRYWRLASGIEVDFILGDMEAAIEVKATDRVRPQHLHGLEQLGADHPEVGPRILVCLENAPASWKTASWSCPSWSSWTGCGPGSSRAIDLPPEKGC